MWEASKGGRPTALQRLIRFNLQLGCPASQTFKSAVTSRNNQDTIPSAVASHGELAQILVDRNFASNGVQAFQN